MSMQTAPIIRRQSVPVLIGDVSIGGGPVVVQSMTNTDTADVTGTAEQVAALARAGSEIVRITVDRDEAAKAVPHIRDALDKMGCNVPLVGDFHYIVHKLLLAVLDKFSFIEIGSNSGVRYDLWESKSIVLTDTNPPKQGDWRDTQRVNIFATDMVIITTGGGVKGGG